MDASINAPYLKSTSRLDRFLYAPIREDANGLMITVLSAMARQELDPWEEAAKWAQLARSSAIQRVTELIATVASGPPVSESSLEAANRLVTLLPREPAHAAAGRPGEGHESNKISFTMIGLMAMLIFQWLIFRDAASDIQQSSAAPPVATATHSATPLRR
jgi:hypothetical protein